MGLQGGATDQFTLVAMKWTDSRKTLIYGDSWENRMMAMEGFIEHMFGYFTIHYMLSVYIY